MRKRAWFFAAAGLVLCLHLAAGVFAAEAGTESASGQRSEREWHSNTEFPIWVETAGATWEDELTGAEITYEYPVFTIAAGGMEALQSALDSYSEEQENQGKLFVRQQKASVFQYLRRDRLFDEWSSRRECYTSIIRADEHIVSILTKIDEYVWDADGVSLIYESLNVDPSTGEVIGLGDVIRTPDALPAILEQTFALQGDPETLTSSVSEVTKQLMDEGRFSFVVGMEGVSFYYPKNTLRPHYYGDIILTLYYDEYPELFVEGIPFAGDYCTPVNPYLDCGYFEDGRRVHLGYIVLEEYDNHSLFFYPDMLDSILSERIYLLEDFYGNIENSVYLVRTNGRHVIYVHAPERIPDMEPENSFRAFAYNPEGTMEKTEADPAVISYILDPVDQSSIELEAYVHPEHTIYAMYLDGDVSASYVKNFSTYEYEFIYFDPETEERHAFIDLDGDGADEMYIESAAHSWPYSFYMADYGQMCCIQLKEYEEVGADRAGESVLVLNDGRVAVTGDGTDGRESWRVYRYTGFKVFELETAYTRVRNDPSRPGEDICTRYTEGAEEEITLQEYQSAVDELLSQAIEMPFVENR